MENRPQFVYKYLSVSDITKLLRLRDIITKHRIYFPAYNVLNDPLEGSAVDIPITGSMGHSILRIMDEEDPMISSRKEGYKILSFSSDPRSPQLWAHYGGNYTGVCLCFSTNGAFSKIQKVDYLKDGRPPQIEEPECEEYSYGSSEEEEEQTIAELIEDNFLMKQAGWEYESEWRIVEKSQKQYITFKKDELVGIIFGELMDSQLEKIISSWIRKPTKKMRCIIGKRSFRIRLTRANYHREDSGGGEPIPEIRDIDKYLLEG